MLVTTPAVVLHAFRYGETSKIVRLSTRDHGVQSVLAKGATRSKSRFGARLQVLSEGMACFYLKAHRDLHTLSAFDVTTQRLELAGDLNRYASASALAELVLRCSPAEPHPEIFHLLSAALDRLVSAEREAVDVVALASLWSVVVALGFAPAVDVCVRCGKPPAERAAFSLAEGGLLCARCGRGVRGAALGRADQAALAAFVDGSTDVPPLPAKHLVAHRRLLARFVRQHLSEDRELNALTFWEGR